MPTRLRVMRRSRFTPTCFFDFSDAEDFEGESPCSGTAQWTRSLGSYCTSDLTSFEHGDSPFSTSSTQSRTNVNTRWRLSLKEESSFLHNKKWNNSQKDNKLLIA